MKMRVMYSSKKARMKTYASALSQAFDCQLDQVPPAFPCDKERLLILCITCKDDPSDELRRFCGEVYPNRAANVALVIDGTTDSRGYKIIRDQLKNTGTNIIENKYILKCGSFGKKISLEERQKIVDWGKEIIASLEG